jgi:hypothetical protein
MGAATFTITGHEVLGSKRIVKGDLVLSSSYATGGDSLDLAAEVGLAEVRSMLVAENTTGASIDLDVTDPTAPLVVLYTSADTEAAAASDNDALTFPVWLFGTA